MTPTEARAGVTARQRRRGQADSRGIIVVCVQDERGERIRFTEPAKVFPSDVMIAKLALLSA